MECAFHFLVKRILSSKCHFRFVDVQFVCQLCNFNSFNVQMFNVVGQLCSFNSFTDKKLQDFVEVSCLLDHRFNHLL